MLRFIRCFVKKGVVMRDDYSRRRIGMEQFMDPYGILSINAAHTLQVTSAINIEKKVHTKMLYSKNATELDLDKDFSEFFALKFEDPYDILHQKMRES